MTEAQAKPLSKTAKARVEVTARREAREAKRADEAERLIAAREQVTEISKSMPSDFQTWGVIRTRAYISLLDITLGKVDNKTVKPAMLERLLDELKNASNWTLDYCQHLSVLHARAADIGRPSTEVS